MPRRISRLGRPWRTRKRRKVLGRLRQAREARLALKHGDKE